MPPPHVLVLTYDHEDDPHTTLVREHLARRGARTTIFDPRRYPVAGQVDLTYRSGQVRRFLSTSGETVDLDGLAALWLRRPMPVEPDPALTDPAIADYVAKECQTFLTGLWEHLGCPQFPAKESILRRAGHKSFQLALAAELGFVVPETVITTSAEAFLDFHDRHDGQIITKPLNTPWVQGLADGGMVARYCETVSPRDVAYADALRFCPIIVQERIPKSVELRVTAVGGRVFAAEIHSQASNRSRLDWRRYDIQATPHLVHRLPDEVAARCLALLNRLDLRYGAIDLILTPEGRYFFLEINPNGQWLWIEKLTGLPISEAVCDVLLEGA
ncbi:MvdC/MvdD family ATP grasp protein [Streptosporangium sp. NPDC000396]|uniref:MvdC/MvdD family ATP grasp protein n=1 Tax=Streptosporangium sp. NPDC000396 TaxID=3366185 RepID=UPI00367B8274